MSHFSDQYITDCDSRTSDDDYLDRRDGVSSAPVLPKSTTAIDNTEIKYDRITKDFAILVDGQVIGYGRNYSEAEAKRTAYLAERDTATDLDGGTVECSEPDNHCELHNPCPAHASDAARYLAENSITTDLHAPSFYALLLADCQAELDARMAEPVGCVTCGGDGDCPDCDPDTHFDALELSEAQHLDELEREREWRVADPDVEFAPVGWAA